MPEIQGFRSDFGKQGTQRSKREQTRDHSSVWEVVNRSKYRQAEAFLTMAHSLFWRTLDSLDSSLRITTCFCALGYLCSITVKRVEGIPNLSNKTLQYLLIQMVTLHVECSPKRTNLLKSNHNARKHALALF